MGQCPGYTPGGHAGGVYDKPPEVGMGRNIFPTRPNPNLENPNPIEVFYPTEVFGRFSILPDRNLETRGYPTTRMSFLVRRVFAEGVFVSAELILLDFVRIG